MQTQSSKEHSKKGFTLVEVIVVAVIVSILAAVAIPNYQQYLEDSRQDAVDNIAETAAAMANSWVRKKGVDPSVTDLDLFIDTTKYTVTISSPNVTVSGEGKTATRAFK